MSNTMTSLDFLNNIINPARVGAGESKHENTKFLLKVVDELDLDETGKKFQLGKTGHKMPYYDLTEDQMRLVGMRESKAVRRAVLAELNRLYAKAKEDPKSLADMLEDAARQIREKDQKIRDRALRGVLVPPTKLVREYCVRTGRKLPGGTRGAAVLNDMLITAGLQVRGRNRIGQNIFTPTELGQSYSKTVSSTGLEWDLSVIDLLLGDGA